MSLDPAPTLLCVRKGRAVGSVCDSRAKYFFKLSTHTIVYLQSHVHNRDIATSVKSFFSETLRVFQRDCAAGLGAHCAVAVARTICSNENPGAAAGVLHSLRIVLSGWTANPFRACRRSRAIRRPCSNSSRRRPSTSVRHDRRRGSTGLARRRCRPAFPSGRRSSAAR